MTPEEQRIVDAVTTKLLDLDVRRTGQQAWVVAMRRGTIVTSPYVDEQDAADAAPLQRSRSARHAMTPEEQRIVDAVTAKITRRLRAGDRVKLLFPYGGVMFGVVVERCSGGGSCRVRPDGYWDGFAIPIFDAHLQLV